MIKKFIGRLVLIPFLLTSLGPIAQAHADSILNLPAPGTMVNLSPAYQPVMIKGLTVHKDNPFLFDFIVDVGQDKMSGEPLKKEGEKLIKYFLASLAIPDKDVWVNLSPYEKDRMIPGALGQTDMGRDLLEQDYILKQITASLIYPEKQLGKNFWNTVYSKAQQEYGTTQIPVNTFNKVWIMADKAEVFERNQTAFVVDSHLKVMLEEDYLALKNHTVIRNNTDSIGSNIVRQIILPELEKEVNTGKNFANLRQIFNSIILSSWYKKNLQQALLNQVYADKSKVKGINLSDPSVKQQIYEQYLEAYKKGVFNYIKEDVNAANGQAMPRKYFSGGLEEGAADNPTITNDSAMLAGAFEQDNDGFVDIITAFTNTLKPTLDVTRSLIKKALQYVNASLNGDAPHPSKGEEIFSDLSLLRQWIKDRTAIGRDVFTLKLVQQIIEQEGVKLQSTSDYRELSMNKVEEFLINGTVSSFDPFKRNFDAAMAVAPASAWQQTTGLYMVNPTNYYMDYSINPYMDLTKLPDKPLAYQQWKHYISVLREHGVNVDVSEQGEGVPDQVYAANAGLAVEGKDGKKYFIPARFATEERQPEEALFIDHFRKLGYIIADVVKGYDWEGEGDLLFFNGHMLAGFNRYNEKFNQKDWKRSDPEGQKQVADALGISDDKLLLLELQHPEGKLYHLDTAVFPLDDETIIYHKDTFSPDDQQRINKLAKNVIYLSDEDAQNFAANAVSIPSKKIVVLHKGISEKLRAQIEAVGYRVIEVDMSEFLKSGGTTKCCVLKLPAYSNSNLDLSKYAWSPEPEDPPQGLIDHLQNPYLARMKARVNSLLSAFPELKGAIEEVTSKKSPHGDWDKIQFGEENVSIYHARIQNSVVLGPAKGGIRFVTASELMKIPEFKENWDKLQKLDPTEDEVKSFISKWITQEAEALAMGMTLKNAGIGLDLGGGKGAVFIGIIKDNGGKWNIEDAPDWRDKKLQAKIARIHSRFLAEKRLVGIDKDIPAPDMNTDGNILSIYEDEYIKYIAESTTEIEKLYSDYHAYSFINPSLPNDPTKTPYLDAMVKYSQNHPGAPVPWLGVYTGKPLDKGGVEGRGPATGRGVVALIKAALGENLKGKTVAIQGFGNVAQPIGPGLIELGAKLTVINDAGGAYINKSGFSIETLNKLIEWKSLPGNQYKLIRDASAEVFDRNGIEIIEGDSNSAAQEARTKAVLEADVDILVPAAMEGQITKTNAPNIKAKYIFEGANGPTSPDAEKILYTQGTVVYPDTLANSGGVFVSSLETEQAKIGEKFSEGDVNAKLEETIRNTYSKLKELEVNHPSLTIRQLMDVLALTRIQKKMDAAMSSYPSKENKAMATTNGGIDLNTSNGMQWKVNKDGNGVEMNIDPAMIERIKEQGIESLSPVILKISPVTNLWHWAGIQEPEY